MKLDPARVVYLLFVCVLLAYFNGHQEQVLDFITKNYILIGAGGAVGFAVLSLISRQKAKTESEKANIDEGMKSAVIGLAVVAAMLLLLWGWLQFQQYSLQHQPILRPDSSNTGSSPKN